MLIFPQRNKKEQVETKEDSITKRFNRTNVCVTNFTPTGQMVSLNFTFIKAAPMRNMLIIRYEYIIQPVKTDFLLLQNRKL